MEKFKVLYLSPEVTPFAKTGGLADVAGSLPNALRGLGMDVRVAMPLYGRVRQRDHDLRPVAADMEVLLGDRRLTAHVLECPMGKDTPVYFIKQDDLYDRPGLYGDERGDYKDNLKRFSFFCHAALRLMCVLPFQPDILHCNDWQTGLVPPLLKGPYGYETGTSALSTVFTIHNLSYQGIFPAEDLPFTGLSPDEFFHAEGVEFWGKISLLKAGLVFSEAITTVSPTYAKEIQSREMGMGMEGILRQRGSLVHGILNGVDYGQWDPARDPHIAAPFTSGDLAGKWQCKRALIAETGLDRRLEGRPLLGMVSRLIPQKGLDLVLELLEDMKALDALFVILCSGKSDIAEPLQAAARRRPGQTALFFGFDEPLAHRIIAGSDLFLIPSRYEPCGLTQMYALKYGAVPVARATGGLDDTIAPFNKKTGEGNGFKFGPYRVEALMAAIKEGLDLYKDKEAWNRLIANGMNENFSWDRSAEHYQELYQQIARKR